MKKEKTEPWLYAAVGVGLAGLVWWIFRRTPAPPQPSRMTVSKEVAPVTPPEELPSAGAVAVRFDEVRELYKMGYLTPQKAISQTEALEESLAGLLVAGQAEQHAAEALVAHMETFIREVRSYQASMTTPGA